MIGDIYCKYPLQYISPMVFVFEKHQQGVMLIQLLSGQELTYRRMVCFVLQSNDCRSLFSLM